MLKQNLLTYMVFILLLTSLWPTACTKRYEEDPFTVRFLSLKKRLTGEWKMQKILIDAKDFSYLIEMENDTFYAIYEFKEFSKKYYGGKVLLKTKNKSYIHNYSIKYSLNRLETNNNSISFSGRTPGIKIGPINNFEPARIDTTFDIGSQTPNLSIGFWYEWDIKKLTNKQMHIAIYANLKYYELFFEKSKS